MNDARRSNNALRALSLWTRRQWLAAAGFTGGFGLLVGVSTVIIPNSMFSQEIPTPWSDYPEWTMTSLLAGLLAAIYVRPAPVGEQATVTKRDARGGLS